MKTGFAKLEITPPFGAYLSGYFSRRPADGIKTPLYAHAVAFSDGEHTAAVISCDIIGIRQVHMDTIRNRVAANNNIPYEAVFIACTHTHTAPEVNDGRGSPNDPNYNEYLFSRISDAVSLAIADLKSTTVEIARGEAKDISFIRRYRMKDGSVVTNPGYDNPNVDHPLGTPDEAVQLVKLVREDAADIAIVNFQVHPDTVGGTKICADFPGFVVSTLEAALASEKDGKGVHVVYFNGAQGDTNHLDNSRPITFFSKGKDSTRHAQHMGRVIAGAVLSIYSYTEPVADGKVAFGQTICHVATNKGTPEQVAAAKELIKFFKEKPEEAKAKYTGMLSATVQGEASTWIQNENEPDFLQLYVTAISFGDVAFAGIPGEPFTDIGRGIKSGSNFTMTIPCCCANGYQGYFPVQSAYSEGGYEARSSKFRPGVAEALIETSVSLVNSLK